MSQITTSFCDILMRLRYRVKVFFKYFLIFSGVEDTAARKCPPFKFKI